MIKYEQDNEPKIIYQQSHNSYYFPLTSSKYMKKTTISEVSVRLSNYLGL